MSDPQLTFTQTLVRVLSVWNWKHDARIRLGIACIFLFVLVVPFTISDNAAAQILFSVLLALVTTIVSIVETRKSAKDQLQGELTKYGLQAFRYLENLSRKIRTRRMSLNAPLSTELLDAWLNDIQSDIDHAKQTWQDLLREQPRLTRRLEGLEQLDIEIDTTQDPLERAQLMRHRDQEIALLASGSPLIPIPVDIPCPYCRSTVRAELGKHRGDTSRPSCNNCHRRFFIHRQMNGGVAYGGDIAANRPRECEWVSLKCPNVECKKDMRVELPLYGSVLFETECRECGTHVQISGNCDRNSAVSLGKENATMKCPSCQNESSVWISPQGARFLKRCGHCGKSVEIEGTPQDFQLSMASAELPSDNAKIKCPSCQNESSVWISPQGARFLKRCGHCGKSVEIEGTPQDFRLSMATVELPSDPVARQKQLSAQALAAFDGMNFVLAREHYIEASRSGMPNYFLILDLALVDIAEKKYEDCLNRLPAIGGSPAMEVSYAALEAIA